MENNDSIFNDKLSAIILSVKNFWGLSALGVLAICIVTILLGNGLDPVLRFTCIIIATLAILFLIWLICRNERHSTGNKQTKPAQEASTHETHKNTPHETVNTLDTSKQNTQDDTVTYELFISSPMASISTNKKYKSDRQLVIDIISHLNTHCNISTVYFAGNAIANQNAFEAPNTSLERNLKALTHSKSYILIYPEKLASSILFEAGYAFALNKPAIYFVKGSTDNLPFLLQGAAQATDFVEIHKYNNTSDIKRILVERQNLLQNCKQTR